MRLCAPGDGSFVHESQCAQLANLPLIDRGLKREVELVEVAAMEIRCAEKSYAILLRFHVLRAARDAFRSPRLGRASALMRRINPTLFSMRLRNIDGQLLTHGS